MFKRIGRLLAVCTILSLVAAVLLVPVQAAPGRNAQTPALVFLHGASSADVTAMLGRAPIETYDEFVLVNVNAEETAILENAGMGVEAIPVDTIKAGGYKFSANRPAAVPADLKGSGNMYLVHFVGPIKAEWVDGIEALGAEVCDYLPNFTFVVKMDKGACARVAAHDKVDWVGPYHAAYRIDPTVKAGHSGPFEVSLFPGCAAADVIAAAGSLDLAADGNTLVLKGNGAAARALAQVDGVAWITPFNEPQLHNAVARGVIKSDVVHSKGISGAGGAARQIAAISDTGVYWDHECFTRPGMEVAYIDIAGDSAAGGGDGYGHGTHCTGTILGDAPTYDTWNKYDGHGYGANYVAVKIFDNNANWAAGSDYYGFWNQAYGYGARINSNSWGSASGGAYSTSDSHADRVQWDHRDYLLSISAGNSGSSGANTIGSPGVSKNSITVGSVETASPENLSYFSSRGPTDDGRLKPDVTAPGHYIHSAQAGTTSGYVDMMGTSMACPTVAGSALLVRDYYMRGFYPSGAANSSDAFTPSAAMMKATLIGGAVEMTGTYSDRNGEGVYPNNSQGFGRINLDNSLYFSGDDRLMKVWDSPQNLGTGSSWSGTYNLTTATDRALKVTLVWTDYYGSGLKNNLDLEVTAPGGTVYKGNNFTSLNPGYSVSGGSFDSVNNVEGVHLLPGYSTGSDLPTGTWTIKVYGTNVPYSYSNFAVVVSEYDFEAGTPPTEEVAVMGDYSGQIAALLTGAGYSVRSYSSSDYSGVIANLDKHKVVCLHTITNATGLDDLRSAANTMQKGLIYMSSYTVSSHAMGIIDARYNDPAYTAHNWGGGAVQVKVEATHPVFDGYSLGQIVTIINGGDNDYQSYDSWSGTNIGSSQMASGYPWFIGIKDRAQTGGAKWVVMGSFGACSYTNTSHWTADGKQVFFNAVDWAMTP